jgi:hypothetical protein
MYNISIGIVHTLSPYRTTYDREYTMSTMTPYAAAKIVNATLEAEGIEKVIPPQMMYTYAKKGYVASVLVDNKKRITEEGLQEWLQKYVARLLGNTIEETDENIDANQLDLFDTETTEEVVVESE